MCWLRHCLAYHPFITFISVTGEAHTSNYNVRLVHFISTNRAVWAALSISLSLALLFGMFDTRDEGVLSKHIILCFCLRFFLLALCVIIIRLIYLFRLVRCLHLLCSFYSTAVRAFCQRLGMRYLSVYVNSFASQRQYICDLICALKQQNVTIY